MSLPEKRFMKISIERFISLSEMIAADEKAAAIKIIIHEIQKSSAKKGEKKYVNIYNFHEHIAEQFADESVYCKAIMLRIPLAAFRLLLYSTKQKELSPYADHLAEMLGYNILDTDGIEDELHEKPKVISEKKMVKIVKDDNPFMSVIKTATRVRAKHDR